MSKGTRLRTRPHNRAKIEEKRDRTRSLFIKIMKQRREDEEEAQLRGMSIKQLHALRRKNAKESNASS